MHRFPLKRGNLNLVVFLSLLPIQIYQKHPGTPLVPVHRMRSTSRQLGLCIIDIPLCTKDVAGCAANQSNVKNKNNFKFQFNAYLLTIFNIPNIELYAGNKIKEEYSVPSSNNLTN